MNIPEGWRLLEKDETPQHGDRYDSEGRWFPIEIRLPKDFSDATKIIRYISPINQMNLDREKQLSEKSVDEIFSELRCIDKQLWGYHSNEDGSLNRNEFEERISRVHKLLDLMVKQFDIEHQQSCQYTPKNKTNNI